MAKTIVGGVVTVNGVDLSAECSSVEVNQNAEDHDVTGMSASAREHLLGLSDDSMTLNFWQDFAAAKVDATLAPLQGSNSPVAVVVQTGSTPGSKKWTMQGLLPNYTPFAGAKGEPSATEAQFLNGDGVGIVAGTVV